MADHDTTLQELRTALIDARIGYEEALDDADAKGLTPLFREMIELHTHAIGELGDHLAEVGAEVKNEPSFMAAVHRAVISIRSVLTGLDESILPGLIDGEKRNLAKYDEALKVERHQKARNTIEAQRALLSKKIEHMSAQARAAGKSV